MNKYYTELGYEIKEYFTGRNEKIYLLLFGGL